MCVNPTYLFDFDGMLVDSMPTFLDVMLGILDDHGIRYDADIGKIITPLGYRGTADYYRTLGIPTPTEQLIADMNMRARQAYAERIEAKSGVPETLRELRRRGASLNVLTASPHEMLDPCLKRVGLWALFDHVWSCDDFRTTKSDPEIYRLASERLGRSVREIVFVDDNLNAVKTAKSAGMHAYGIYDASSAAFAAEMRSVSERYLQTFAELSDP